MPEERPDEGPPSQHHANGLHVDAALLVIYQTAYVHCSPGDGVCTVLVYLICSGLVAVRVDVQQLRLSWACWHSRDTCVLAAVTLMRGEACVAPPWTLPGLAGPAAVPDELLCCCA